MGAPNFRRLAELGQLPEYAKEFESMVEVNEKAVAKKSKKVVKEEEPKLTKADLIAKCVERGLSTEGNRNVLEVRLEEFEAAKSSEEGKEDKDKTPGTFEDDILG